jgi:hypothetical protein
MNPNFISLLDAAENLAGDNDDEVEMWLALLTTDADEGRLPCTKSWTEHRNVLPGGVSFDRPPGEWRVLRTALKTWMEVRAIRQAFGQSEPSATGEPVPATQSAPATGKTWTPERLAEVKAYRERNGTKAAASHFGISEALIRRKLPSTPPRPVGHSVFTHHIK